jgi:hypothetical protein
MSGAACELQEVEEVKIKISTKRVAMINNLDLLDTLETHSRSLIFPHNL